MWGLFHLHKAHGISLPPTCLSLVCNVITFHNRTSVSTPLVTNPYGDMSHTICDDDNYSNVSTQLCHCR